MPNNQIISQQGQAKLTEIAAKLKATFPGFEAPGYEAELKRFRARYGEAESIRVDGMDYIVINGVYRIDDEDDRSEGGRGHAGSNTSPLFYNSINNAFAIIDSQTSSTLIDEVYSRVTYMQRDCVMNARTPAESDVQNLFRPLVGDGDTIAAVQIPKDDEDESAINKRANIFQCQLIKDTGVSATPDVYSFMLKGGEIKEVSDNAIKKIQGAGTVRMLDDSNMEELQSHESAIQEAVFEKYLNSDVDIQSITVKSIFEIKMRFCNVFLLLQSNFGKTRLDSIFNTTYLLSETNEFDALNANIHICNCCGHDLVDSRDERLIHKLHTNMDAYDERATMEAFELTSKKNAKSDPMDHMVYAVGCEDCLEECPCCHTWHFDYKKMVGSKAYDRVKLVPGREFIKGIRSFNFNYCACREGIEWVYDERSGGDREHDVIPIDEMVFINSANEKMADYEEYKAYYEREKDRANPKDAIAERTLARQTLNKFKNYLAGKYEMSISGIAVTAAEKCHECSTCGGEYYGMLSDDRCAVCTEIFDENRHMVTRVDGVVFMLHGRKKHRVISKYIVTRFGNLKKISAKLVEEIIHTDESTPPPLPEEETAVKREETESAAHPYSAKQHPQENAGAKEDESYDEADETVYPAEADPETADTSAVDDEDHSTDIE